MNESRIISWARVVDGQGSMAALDAKWADLRAAKIRTVELIIDPLEAGWDTPVAPDHFRSGCAPIEALTHADLLVRQGQADAVLIRGQDLLRTRYANDKPLRQQLMSIYGPDCSIPQAYTLLAHAFIRRHGMTADSFRALAAALFENYRRTAQARGIKSEHHLRPDALAMVSDLFRLVDCANPVVDFTGALIIAKAALAFEGDAIIIRGVGLGQTRADGPAHVEELATYTHLASAYENACKVAKIDFAAEFRSGRALLDAYTCYPVAPLGFLLASGIAQSIASIPALLAKHEITVTGGMNLARAPWNNPSLNALIVMCDRLQAGDAPLGVVHGNGGLGYRQSVAILSR